MHSHSARASLGVTQEGEAEMEASEKWFRAGRGTVLGVVMIVALCVLAIAADIASRTERLMSETRHVEPLGLR